MKRYYESHNCGEYEGMEECDDGDWVRYEDVQELQRQLDEERARLDWLVNFCAFNCMGQWFGNQFADGMESIGNLDDTIRQAIDRERIKGEKA